MAKLNKISDGLFFFENFSEQSLQWTLSPSDANCLSFGDNGLQMKHNNRYVTYTIIEPSTEEYSCVVNLDHIPRTLEDIAGILVMSNTKEYAECQSFMATEPSELGNTNGENLTLKSLIAQILNDQYVEYSIDDEEINTNNIDIENNTDISKEGVENYEDTEAVIFVDTLYHYIKFTKNKYKYVFWASEDGNKWIEVGNVKFDDSGVIGFFIYGTTDSEILNNSHCFFKTFALYKSKYITINGIERKQEMEIYDKNGTILMRTDNIKFTHMISRSSKQCIINTTTMPMPIQNGKLRIYSKTNYENTIAEFDLGEEVYGGDSFTLERDIRLFINNQELNPLEPYNLGVFYRGSYYIKVDIYNKENYILTDVKVKVIKYSEYYGGEEAVAVALYDENKIESELVYNKEIVINELIPSESRSFFMKLIDKPVQDFYMTANDYRFKIIIE